MAGIADNTRSANLPTFTIDRPFQKMNAQIPRLQSTSLSLYLIRQCTYIYFAEDRNRVFDIMVQLSEETKVCALSLDSLHH